MRIGRTVLAAVAALGMTVSVLGACGGPTAATQVAPTQVEASADPTVQPKATEALGTATSEAQPTSVPPTPTTKPTEASAASDGELLLDERCTACHSVDRVAQSRKTRDEWEKTVTRMIGSGANLDANEKDILIEYLAATYGP